MAEKKYLVTLTKDEETLLRDINFIAYVPSGRLPIGMDLYAAIQRRGVIHNQGHIDGDFAGRPL
jgi:hypothetical protein